MLLVLEYIKYMFMYIERFNSLIQNTVKATSPHPPFLIFNFNRKSGFFK